MLKMEYDEMIEIVMGKRNRIVKNGMIGKKERWINEEWRGDNNKGIGVIDEGGKLIGRKEEE